MGEITGYLGIFDPCNIASVPTPNIGSAYIFSNLDDSGKIWTVRCNSSNVRIEAVLEGGSSASLYKGVIDLSANPNYPPALVGGEFYIVSVAGKIGGNAGVTANVGDLIIAEFPNAGGDQASVGADWDVVENGFNLVYANEVDVRTGTNTTKVTTPNTVRQAIQEGRFTSVDGQIVNNAGNTDVLCSAPNGGLDSVQDGAIFTATFAQSGAQSSTGTNTTLTLSPLAAKPLLKVTAGGAFVALSVGDLVKGNRIAFQYELLNDRYIIIYQSQLLATLSDMSAGIFNTPWPAGTPVDNRLVTPKSVRQGIQSGLAFNEYIFSQAGSSYIGTNDYNAITDQFVDDYAFQGVFGSASVGNDTMSIVTTAGTQGPFPIRKQDGAGNYIALSAGDIQAGGTASFISDLGNNRIILMSNGIISTFPSSQGNINPYFNIEGENGAVDLTPFTYMKTLAGSDNNPFANKSSILLTGLTNLKSIILELARSSVNAINLSTLASLISFSITAAASLANVTLPTVKTVLKYFFLNQAAVLGLDFTLFVNLVTIIIENSTSITTLNISDCSSLVNINTSSDSALSTLTYNANNTALLNLNMTGCAFNDATAMGNLLVMLDSNGLLNGNFDISGGTSVGGAAILLAVPAAGAAAASLAGKGWTVSTNA